MSPHDASLDEQLSRSGRYNGVGAADWPDDDERQDPDPGSEQSDSPDEHEIQERLHRLRIAHEARRRLDQELRPEIVLPAVTPLDELLAEPDTPTRYRIDRLALDGARIMLSAQYKAGKTTIVANLLRALADGEKFLGRFDVKIPAKRIVLIDDELDKDTLKRWLRDQQIVNTAAIVDTVSLRGRLGSFNLIDDRCRDQWSRRLSDLGCDYLILDCLRPVLDALGLDENKDAGQFLVGFDTMLFGAGVSNSLMVQHMGHTGERSRGDSRLQDWPDAIWRLVRESEEPDSARFFSAFGRDVNVPEGRLSYSDRRLSYSDGNRADAKTEAAVIAVLTLLSGDAVNGGDGLSGSAIDRDLGGEHTQKAVRLAVKKLVNRGRVNVVKGHRGAKIHTIAKPCEQCGLPVLSGDPRHRSCSDVDLEGLLT